MVMTELSKERAARWADAVSGKYVSNVAWHSSEVRDRKDSAAFRLA